MIDAYEIGIQLLLQDDVSAGLAVINKGLAEVDRAIAATSADLVGLTKNAETATKAVAVAAAASGRVVPRTASEGSSGGVTEPVAPNQPIEVLIPPPAVATSENAAAPETVPKETAATATQQVNTAPVDRRDPPQAPVSDSNVSSGAAAAVATRGFEHVIDDKVANIVPAEPRLSAAFAPKDAAPVKLPTHDTISPITKEIPNASQDFNRGAMLPSFGGALTASIRRAHKLEVPSAAPLGRTRAEVVTVSAADRDRAVAPWSGVGNLGTKAEAARSQERAVAPKSTGQELPTSGGGTVMLDGRLVGHWLSEHMAREASRPPAGTSFFDPRQTPAWNVSGAL